MGWLPQVGVKINNIWNHRPEILLCVVDGCLLLEWKHHAHRNYPTPDFPKLTCNVVSKCKNQHDFAIAHCKPWQLLDFFNMYACKSLNLTGKLTQFAHFPIPKIPLNGFTQLETGDVVVVICVQVGLATQVWKITNLLQGSLMVIIWHQSKQCNQCIFKGKSPKLP